MFLPMNFLQLLDGVEVLSQDGDASVSGLEYDSRKLKPGYVFVAMRGESTNGKSTTAFLLEAILSAANRKSLLVGTIEYHVAGQVLLAPHTTPEALELNQLFATAVKAGASESVMEVSSHALEQQRVFGIGFDVAVFTNLTRDHLDYHLNMEQYFAAKRQLFEGCGVDPPRVAVLNADDAYGQQLQTICKTRGSRVVTYGLEAAEFRAENVAITFQNTRFRMVTPQGAI